MHTKSINEKWVIFDVGKFYMEGGFGGQKREGRNTNKLLFQK